MWGKTKNAVWGFLLILLKQRTSLIVIKDIRETIANNYSNLKALIVAN